MTRDELARIAAPILVKEQDGYRYVDDLAAARRLGIECIAPGLVVDLTR
jgi:hypothetical protein